MTEDAALYALTPPAPEMGKERHTLTALQRADLMGWVRTEAAAERLNAVTYQDIATRASGELGFTVTPSHIVYLHKQGVARWLTPRDADRARREEEEVGILDRIRELDERIEILEEKLKAMNALRDTQA